MIKEFINNPIPEVFFLLGKSTEDFFSDTLPILINALPEYDKSILRHNNICISICFSPGSTLHNVNLPNVPEGSNFNIVTIEMNIIRLLKFDKFEIAALILHEFGHLLNDYNIKPDNKSFIQGLMNDDMNAVRKRIEEPKEIELLKEFHADYFVKKCGLSQSLITSLEKCLNSNISFLNEKADDFKERILKLQSDEVFIGSIHPSLIKLNAPVQNQ